jgi:hypothetical protein
MLGLLLNKGAEQAEESNTTPVKPHNRQRPTGRMVFRRAHAPSKFNCVFRSDLKTDSGALEQ